MPEANSWEDPPLHYRPVQGTVEVAGEVDLTRLAMRYRRLDRLFGWMVVPRQVAFALMLLGAVGAVLGWRAGLLVFVVCAVLVLLSVLVPTLVRLRMRWRRRTLGYPVPAGHATAILAAHAAHRALHETVEIGSRRYRRRFDDAYYAMLDGLDYAECARVGADAESWTNMVRAIEQCIQKLVESVGGSWGGAPGNRITDER